MHHSLLFLLIVFFLAYWNGANDNFKGVATLWGSRLTNYKKALFYANFMTFLGSVLSFYLAEELIKNFSGYNFFPKELLNNPFLYYSIIGGASISLLLATILGLPVSTTHSIIGSLFGITILIANKINLNFLFFKFVLPLIFSPFIAIAFTFLISYAISSLSKKDCICMEQKQLITNPPIAIQPWYKVYVDSYSNCYSKSAKNIIGINLEKILNILHYISAGIVSFARGLNDTPKLLGLIVINSFLDIHYNLILISIAIALGGLLHAKKVAFTMSKKITSLNHQQGFISNFTTGFIVIIASIMGSPVSTTHISVGSLFGIGIITKHANIKKIGEIIISWFILLPLSGTLSTILYKLFEITIRSNNYN
jgi:PiT family inorganic phosphate transporter